MANISLFLPLFLLLTGTIPLLIGIYLVIKGIWAYKEGDRGRFIKYLFFGLVLIFVVPGLVGITIGSLMLIAF